MQSNRTLENLEMTAPQNTLRVVYWDSHFHGRLPPVMNFILPQKAARTCGGSLEPNTKQPHLTTYDVVMWYLDQAYRIEPDRVWKASIYLDNDPQLKDIERLWREGCITHIKHYPPSGSVHTDESAPYEALFNKNSLPGKAMRLAEEMGLPYKAHPEVAKRADVDIDPYYREYWYFREIVKRMMDTYPELRRVLAHISTQEAVNYMLEFGDPDRYICELTAHHLVSDRRILYDGGAILPDHHCLPVIKEEHHWQALQELFRGKHPYVVAGSDGALHPTKDKYRFDAYGGLNTNGCDLELYIEILEKLSILDYWHDFLYGNAKRFWGDLIPDNPTPVRLVREEWTANERIPIPKIDDETTPFGFHPNPEKRYKFQWKLVA
jgi:dihydroorotase